MELDVLNVIYWYFDVCMYYCVFDSSDTQLRLGHMQQMPEEIRHLQQQACLSSSQHDEMPHRWQRCPNRRQMSHTRQQNTPRFFNSTLQYVIDCNRSTCSASEGAAHSLPSNDESTTVSDELTVVSKSPLRKRPRLAVVYFLTIIVY